MYINPDAAQYSNISRNGISYVEAREVCVLYYMKRGYSREHCEDYVPSCPDKVYRIYNLIQEERGVGGDDL